MRCALPSLALLVIVAAPSAHADTIDFTPAIEARHPVFADDLGSLKNGGPYIGASIEPENGGQLAPRFLAGYEMAAPNWLLYSFQAESNFSDLYALAPGVEAATPLLPIAPHGPAGFGVGAGLRIPLQFGKHSDQGVRFLVSMCFGGVVTVEHDIELMASSGFHYRLAAKLSL